MEMMSTLLRCCQSALRPCLRSGGRWRTFRVAFDPLGDVVVKELFRPDHAGEGLALHVARVSVGEPVLQRGVKGVGLLDRRRSEDGIERGEGLFG
jgi:hypothetical protein